MRKSHANLPAREPRPAPVEIATADRDRKRQRRESVESFVVVFLGFLIWSFEAEGFVIPTGSMAPTLMGRHKEITCPECGYTFTVNADCEVDSNGTGSPTGLRVAWGTCENCRYEAQVADAPSVAGDRIYTMKRGLEIPFLTSAGRVGPGRWEVAVFKLPEEPEVRYIKRLVGMPEEVVRIRLGDLWRRPLTGAGGFERLRRPIRHQQAMQITVHDDAHRATSLKGDPRWKRWAALDGGWTETSDGTYRAGGGPAMGTGDGWSELRYRNVLPDPGQWQAIRENQPLPVGPRPTLITDFSSYNTDLTPESREHPRAAARPWFQPHWVGDLTLSCRVTVREPRGQFRLELIKAGKSNRCEIDLGTGRATLFHEGEALGEPADTSLKAPGTYNLVLANVDDRLTLIIDGGLPFGEGRDYTTSPSDSRMVPTAADLEPARLACRGANLELSGLILKRDVHYTLSPGSPDDRSHEGLMFQGPRALSDFLSDPARFAELGDTQVRDYPLGPGRYLMLGDNSPWSRDGRAWTRRDQRTEDHPDRGWDDSGRESWEVPEALIIGKAFCVYWPHLKPVWPEIRLGVDMRLPARPYLEKVRWIR
jgi:signal peptidase I